MSLYIPIWFYSNKIPLHPLSRAVKLYIPIWFYSNPYRNLPLLTASVFTFQSGSIQIVLIIFSLLGPVNFTFQSGSIQMLTQGQMLKYVCSLHSNLVLFKC